MGTGKGLASIGAAAFAALGVAVIAMSAVSITDNETAEPADTSTTVLYSEQVPTAEQGEGGPDVLPPPESWWVPAGECTHVRDLLERHDLIGPTQERLVWIAMQESDCGAYLVNEDTHDYGIWQVNWPTWAAPLCRNAGICTTPWALAHDDELQAEVVAVLLDWQGWSAWCWSTPAHHARGIGYACPWGDEEQG